MSDPCYVYVIKTNHSEIANDGEFEFLLKVGIADNPRKRLAGLSTGSPFPLTLLKVWRFETRAVALRVEALTHELYDHARQNGEWFFVGLNEIKAGVTGMAIQHWREQQGEDPARLQPYLASLGFDEEEAFEWACGQYSNMSEWPLGPLSFPWAG